MKIHFLLSLFFIYRTAFAGPETFQKMKVRDVQNHESNLIDHTGSSRVLVLLSVAPGCPLVQKSFLKFERLAKKFRKSDLKPAFFYLDSSLTSDTAPMVSEIKKYATTLPLFFDSTQAVAKFVGFESSNQVAILDLHTSEVLYLGAIDSSSNYYTTKSEPKPYLENALQQIDHHQQVNPSKTESFGCAITFKK